MKFNLKDEPRKFKVGLENQIEISDCGEIKLEPNEQVTFITDAGSRFDFAKKDWGFYATPSVNGRLKNEGFKTALVKNMKNQIYVMAVEKTKLTEFEVYCQEEKQKVLEWLDERGGE